MRRLTKSEEPASLVDNAVTWTKDLISAKNAHKPHKKIEGQYQQPDVRDALRVETDNKCAYCESVIDAVAFDHIEHIEPKSKVPEQAFLWSNLTLACPRCNTNKGTRRPTEQNFVHPYDEDPEHVFVFLGPFMRFLPGDIRAQTMIGWLDLNRAGVLAGRAAVIARIQDVFERSQALPIDLRADFLEVSLESLTRPSAQYSVAAKAAISAFRSEYV